jgi:hypothetical protein
MRDSDPSRRLYLCSNSGAGPASATAAARKLTAEQREELLDAYDEWLFYERRLLHIERFGLEAAKETVCWTVCTPAALFHFPVGSDWQAQPQPSTRAESILALIDCGWRKDAYRTRNL